MLTELGKTLRKIRHNRNQKLADMAANLQITASYLSAVENGRKKTPDGWLSKITEKYSLTEDELQELTSVFDNLKKTTLKHDKKDSGFDLSPVQNTEESLKEVCAYVRVSTDKQEELSPDSQIRLIKEYAQAHGMLLTHIYREEHGISGKDAGKRPAFQEMIATCKDKSHPYDAILIWKFSRFARNIDESTYYKSVLRKKCNVDVISISEPIMEGMYGRLIEMVIEWSDEFYLYNLSGEVMRGMTQKAMQGGYNAKPPIGYHKDIGKVPVVDEDEALIVKKIFDLFVNEKRSRADIASILNRQGITTTRGNKWESRTVSYVLENPFYIGKIRWNYYSKEDHFRKKAEDVIIADGKHEPIISNELFEQAGRRIAEERAKESSMYGKKRSIIVAKHWLSSILKCPECGASLTYHNGNKQKKYPSYFSCWKNGKGLCSTNCYISTANAEKAVIRVIQDLASSGDEYLYRQDYKYESQENDTALLKKELDALSAKERRIKDAYMNGIDTLDEYKENKAILTSKRNAIEEQIKKLNKTVPIRKQPYEPVNFNHLLEILCDEKIDYTEKGNAIRDVFDHFDWHKADGTIEAFLNTCVTPVK